MMLSNLRRIIQEVAAASDLSEVLMLMINGVYEAMQAEASSIYLLERRYGDYILRASRGIPSINIGARMQLHNSLVGLVAQRGEPLNLDDATKHPKFHPVQGAERFKAFLGVPIIHQRQVLGVIVVQQEESRKFDEDEVAFLITLSAQLAGVIAHAEVSGLMESLGEGLAREPYNIARLSGIPGAQGIGIGKAVVVYPLADLDAVPERSVEDITAEITHFEAALAAAREDIRLLSERLAPTLPAEERELFNVYMRILDKAGLGDEVVVFIKQGEWAQSALSRVIRERVRQFEAMEDSYLRERAEDIEDLGRRVLSHLQTKEQARYEYPEKTILVGEELTVSAMAEIPEGHLTGIISGKGSGSSHLAILARALGIPAVMGVSVGNLLQLDGHEAIVDGYFGQIYVSPPETLRQEFEQLIREEKELDANLAELRNLPAQTRDGFNVALSVNTGLFADISRSLSVGAEGVGLYRTEIPFIIRERFPTETEQRVIYQQLLAAFAPRPVIMRMLDVGGDKPLPYLSITEDNPFLGWRGLRLTLDHPEIFLVQARAMIRASADYNNLRILLPMVTTMGEVTEAMRLLKQAHDEVKEEGLSIPMPPVGVMIEVPSAVYLARRLAQKTDFLSVGSNDLTQYLLAVDRNNSRVANLYDSLHPAVLRALYYVAQSAHKEGKMASVCGEMASDPVAVILLLAMGFDSLSMNSSSLPRAKWVIRKFTMARAQELLEEVLQMDEPIAIRSHLELALHEMGLGSLIRVGKRQ